MMPVAAVELRTVSATYTFHAPEQMSVEQARHTALQRAINEALAAEFGTMVTHATSTMVDVSGESADNRLIATARSEVRGEWIATIGEPTYDVTVHDGFITVTVTVKGKAREIDFTRPAFSATTLCNGRPATDFHDGDTMTLDFEAPSDGYLAVYLDDLSAGNAIRLIPYILDGNTAMKVEGGRHYRLFSRRDSDSPARVDEVEMAAAGPIELNELHVIYSPGNFALPPVEPSSTGYTPRTIPGKRFHGWLASTRTLNADLQLQTIYITIKNTKQ
ncbi:MAG: DUF4384 domain-containing protein [Candidatus Amulumruptor caecigallinarius]|nr:DUF4384 domain-containing protein [Candidatus Amulumruptor caecigallinarius]MCM1396820.1 DUF4384 domain-containing protein [Candidatus Amulumruptor caecigallinarius]MCM1454236.1 DUF4384 domain-containing protein [bacterium]